MSRVAEQPAAPAAPAWRGAARPIATPHAGMTVRVGRWLNNARLPAALEAVRSGAKKLVWTAFEAHLVSTSLTYAYRELVRPPSLGDYEMRHSGARFSIRHRSGDVDIFRKFYAYRLYEWPPEVRARLAGLGRPVNILDLGANIGFFDLHAREQVAIGRVVAFEPDPANSAVFERVRNANRANWELVRACAANRDGVVSFRRGAHNFSRIDHDSDFTVPAVDVLPYIAQADIVKMNIEGSEWEILQDPRIAATDVVWIVEYHRIGNPEDDITSLVRKLFLRCGYATSVTVSHENNGLVWAWKDRTAV
jgi:FkbM family methyltransferase